ncbi:GIY-YIG nuclease family protein [Alphaproteobacteria bacterium]|nr:GIY-YIG nuclease family protein [Alphaproteobacteria bacterium]
MSEFVYILTNPTIPDLVKIGRTTNLEERLRSLSSHTGVPVPFE